MANDNGSTPDVSTTGLEDDDRVTISGIVQLGYRNKAMREAMGILDVLYERLRRSFASKRSSLSLVGFTVDVEADAALDAQLTAERKAYAKKLAAKKAAAAKAA